ncbi:hypothetical protein PIB30_035396 [Stylosanthes scabra]|uniref:F-box domain-containing protein n=1 Tax=Stylosanthes scabra TaxID=79078 RepID=A0ABU6ZAU1_9FABA|nr:hypothetical protein [Stylosanthes scabra]
MSEVKSKLNFMQWLGPDLSMKILTHLDDPCDLIRVSTLSRSWHKFVIEYGLFKQLCLKKFPEISAHSSVVRIIEVDNMIEPVSDMLGSSLNWEYLKRNHRVYAFLASGLSPISKNCIAKAKRASSTDNYPEHGEMNTMEPRDRTRLGASYWSSKGKSDPSVPEALVYKLACKICLVTEIHVQPFQAYFQPGQPIYSAKAVRFRIGCPKEAYEIEEGATIYLDMLESRILGDEYWTYTSPEYPMLQKNCLQKFKLPEPVLCIGGILQVELLGRVQKKETNKLFYLCVCHVKVVGRLLLPPFDVKLDQPSGKCTLNYCPRTDHCPSLRGNLSSPSQWRLDAFTADIQRSAMSMWEEVIISRRIEREFGGR